MNKYYHTISIYFITLVLTTLVLTGCSTMSESELFAHMKLNENSPRPHSIVIINTSNSVITTIKYRPCKTNKRSYQSLTENLKPSEKLTVNIYSQCVDLLATNAFNKKLVDVKNVNLNNIKTWTIK